MQSVTTICWPPATSYSAAWQSIDFALLEGILRRLTYTLLYWTDGQTDRQTERTTYNAHTHTHTHTQIEQKTSVFRPCIRIRHDILRWHLSFILHLDNWLSGVTREWGGPPRVTPSRGVTPEGKKFCGQIYKEYWRDEVGQVKKVWGDTLEGVTPDWKQ